MSRNWFRNMNVVVVGAGAIGSLFGSALSKNNNVVLVGKKTHAEKINKDGLKIKGKTNAKVKILITNSIEDVFFTPDVLIVSVKSYDTESAIKSSKSILGENTAVMSLQNGLGNIEKIKKYVKPENIIVCITTHGVIFSKPGVINHTGVGRTVVGSISKKNKEIATQIAEDLDLGGIKTIVSEEIIKEIWIKAIINSSINPLTTIFHCKNGYLTENPVLRNIVGQICKESTDIANSYDIDLDSKEMVDKTIEVLNQTSENYSSMLQDLKKNKKSEIDSINGELVRYGNKHKNSVFLNKLLIRLVKSIN